MRVILKNIKFSFTHYQTLNVERSAKAQQIKNSYYKLAKQNHPDMNNSDRESFLKIRQAYDVLINPISRQTYDQEMFPSLQNAQYGYYYGERQRVKEGTSFNLIALFQATFILLIGSYMFNLFTPMTQQEVFQQNFILANQNIDSSPSAQERRKIQYAQEVKDKKIRAKVVELKVSNGSKESTKAKDKRKNSIQSIQGIQKSFGPEKIVVQQQQYI